MEREIKINDKESLFLNQGEATALHLAKQSVADSHWNSLGLIKCNDGESVGYEQAITTLTAIETRVAREKNMQNNVEECIDIVQGPGAWKEVMQYFEGHYNSSASLDSWTVEHAQHNAPVDLSTASLTTKIVPYIYARKAISYTKAELEQAEASGIWNVIEEKAVARKRDFDQMFAKFAMLGSEDGRHDGLLNIKGVTADIDTTINKPLSQMTDAEFNAVLGNIFVGAYIQSQYTEMPNRFIMPAVEKMRLANKWSDVGSGFSTGMNRLARIEDAFKKAVGDETAKVVGVNYADSSLNKTGYDTYALYRKDPFELKIEMPIPYGIYEGTSVDGWHFMNTAMAQFSGVIAKYKQQIKYFKVTA